MWLNPQETADLAACTEDVPNGKLQFFCSEHSAGACLGVWQISIMKLSQKLSIVNIWRVVNIP